MKPSWKGDEIVFSFTSDPYIPMEANYKLTRRCLEVCAEFRNPVGVITKSALIRRDVDVLQRLAEEASVGVYFSIPFADYATARAVEPFAPSPNARFEAMKVLAAAGIQVGIGIAPTIPGLSTDIPGLLQRAKDWGATKAFINMLRLPGSVAHYFEQRLREKLPTKADRVLNRIRDARNGKLNCSQFGERMRGNGQYWEAQEKLFNVYAKRLSFNEHRVGSDTHARAKTFRPPYVASAVMWRSGGQRR